MGSGAGWDNVNLQVLSTGFIVHPQIIAFSSCAQQSVLLESLYMSSVSPGHIEPTWYEMYTVNPEHLEEINLPFMPRSVLHM